MLKLTRKYRTKPNTCNPTLLTLEGAGPQTLGVTR